MNVTLRKKKRKVILKSAFLDISDFMNLLMDLIALQQMMNDSNRKKNRIKKTYTFSSIYLTLEYILVVI